MHPDPHSPVPPCTCGCRLKLVAKLREQIATGNYANEAKLRAAVRSPRFQRDIAQPGQPGQDRLSSAP